MENGRYGDLFDKADRRECAEQRYGKLMTQFERARVADSARRYGDMFDDFAKRNNAAKFSQKRLTAGDKVRITF